MQKKYWLALGLAAVLLLFLGNSGLLITDSVESNYALTAKEMVLSGDWLSPQIYGHYWYDKPIFFYWLTALGFKLFGFTEFAARFFPAIFGLAGLGLVCWGGSKLYNERSGFYSGMILLTSVEFFLISKSVITDAVLFFFFSGTLLYFYLGYREGKKSYWYLMYACAALAVLTKGPVGVLLPGLIITLFLLWQRDWRVLGRMQLPVGMVLFCLLAVPWYAAMYNLHGSAFIDTFFGTHNFLRATVSEHPRDNVIYYYTLVNILALFPWSGLAVEAAYRKLRSGKWALAKREGFLLLWAVVIFVFFQCMATKYLTYTYPLLFPAALLLGHEVEQNMEKYFQRGYLVFMGVFLAFLLGAAWYSVNAGIVEAESLFLLPLSLIIGVVVYSLLQVSTGQKIYGVAAICLLFYMSLVQSIAVPFSAQRSAKDLGALLEQENVAQAGLYGNYPTSAVFYSDTELIKLIHQRDVAGYIPQGYSWSSKNVMPYAALEQENFNMVAVSQRNVERFLQEDNDDNWQIVGQSDRWLLLGKKKSDLDHQHKNHAVDLENTLAFREKPVL